MTETPTHTLFLKDTSHKPAMEREQVLLSPDTGRTAQLKSEKHSFPEPEKSLIQILHKGEGTVTTQSTLRA